MIIRYMIWENNVYILDFAIRVFSYKRLQDLVKHVAETTELSSSLSYISVATVYIPHVLISISGALCLNHPSSLQINVS